MKETNCETRKHREWLTALIWLLVVAAVYAVTAIVLKDGLRYLFLLPMALLFYLLRLVSEELKEFDEGVRGKAAGALEISFTDRDKFV